MALALALTILFANLAARSCTSLTAVDRVVRGGPAAIGEVSNDLGLLRLCRAGNCVIE